MLNNGKSCLFLQPKCNIDTIIMRIEKIIIDNFRCFEHKEIHFHPQFNVIIGENGLGKTAVTDAIAYLLKPYCSFFHLSNLAINKKDIRRLSVEPIEAVSPKNTKLFIAVENFLIKTTTWEIEQNIAMLYETHEMTEKIHNEMRDIFDYNEYISNIPKLPIIAYYPANRTPPLTSEIEADRLAPNASRKIGYENALYNQNIDIKAITARIKTLDYALYAKSKYSKNAAQLIRLELACMQQAMANCIPNVEEIGFDPNDWNELMIHFKDEEPKPFSMLSEGFRNMLAIVADIAHRCARLNPHLNENILTETEGIVIIDEIDLHVHPNWQRNIVGNLKKTFPKIQFIVTTHSPFIVQSAVDRLIDIGKENYTEPQHDLSLHEVAYEILGVESMYGVQNHHKEKQSEAYLSLLAKAEKDELHKEKYIEELTAQEEAISDPGLRALLKMERIAKNII